MTSASAVQGSISTATSAWGWKANRDRSRDMIAAIDAGGITVGVPPPQWTCRTSSRRPMAPASRSISASRVSA